MDPDFLEGYIPAFRSLKKKELHSGFQTALDANILKDVMILKNPMVKNINPDDDRNYNVKIGNNDVTIISGDYLELATLILPSNNISNISYIYYLD